MKLLIIPIFILSLASCKDGENAEYNANKPNARVKRKSKVELPYVSHKDDYYKNQVSTQKLKGNSEIYYTTDDSFKYVYFKHDTCIYKLNSLPLDEGSFYYLGIVISDFEDNFILGHDNGNGAPYSIELINKKTGKNILNQKVVFIEGYYDAKYIVYYNDFDQDFNKKFVVYNLRTGKSEYFKIPNEVFDQSNFNFIRMSVDTILEKQVKVTYEMDSGILTKKYIR